MTKLTKRIRTIREQVDVNKQYNINEAISLLKEMAISNFLESVDAAINLGIDPRKSDQNVRGTIILPYGTGRSVRVAVFARGQNADIARASHAELVGMEDLAEQIKKGNINFDVVIASPDTLHLVKQLGQILGPRGLMPNPKLGTLTQNIAESIKNFRSGQINYRNDKNGIIHATIGKVNFENEKLKENLKALLISIRQSKPPQVKSIYIRKISISSTMGAGITIDKNSLYVI